MTTNNSTFKIQISNRPPATWARPTRTTPATGCCAELEARGWQVSAAPPPRRLGCPAQPAPAVAQHASRGPPLRRPDCGRAQPAPRPAWRLRWAACWASRSSWTTRSASTRARRRTTTTPRRAPAPPGLARHGCLERGDGGGRLHRHGAHPPRRLPGPDWRGGAAHGGRARRRGPGLVRGRRHRARQRPGRAAARPVLRQFQSLPRHRGHLARPELGAQSPSALPLRDDRARPDAPGSGQAGQPAGDQAPGLHRPTRTRRNRSPTCRKRTFAWGSSLGATRPRSWCRTASCNAWPCAGQAGRDRRNPRRQSGSFSRRAGT